MHATEAARLAAASASSLPAIPTWLGIQQKLTVFPARFKDVRSDKISCTRGFVGLKALIAKRLLKESDKMRCKASSLTWIKHRALVIAMSSDVNTVACSGREKDRVLRPLTNAQPTPSSALEPSVNVRVHSS